LFPTKNYDYKGATFGIAHAFHLFIFFLAVTADELKEEKLDELNQK
jgi:hypothetical protein